MTLLLFGVAVAMIAAPQNQTTQKRPLQEENYNRPEPQGPTTPQVPSQNRFQKDKIFLERADSLYREDAFQDIKIVSGNVMFRQGGTVLTCDSAYFFTEQDRANCYGNVRLVQGDTLYIYADKLYYDGQRQFAQLRAGPTARRVRLINRRDTLITDSLDYNLASRLGWYQTGGQLKDPTTLLTSVYGQYSPATKNAEFYHDVVLINKKDKYKLITDTLYYNTLTGIASIDTRTIIEGTSDTIITYGGTYNTKSGFANLTKRSLIVHKDTNNNVVTLEGDSIIYDKASDISRAYMYRSPYKIGRPVVLTDTANKAIMVGGFGQYDNRNRRAVASDYPLLMEYSRPDTLFLRADTIRTFVMKSEPVTDTLGVVLEEAKEYYLAKAYDRARFFRQDIQGIADSITYVELDSMLYLHRKPVVWSDDRQVSGNIIEVHINDSTADWARLPDSGILMELVDEDFYNQLSAKKMLALLNDKSIDRLEAEGNVMVIMLPEEEDSTYNKFVKAESSFMEVDFKDNDLSKLKMWPQVNGTVTPISLVKDADKMLPGARWLDILRPRRYWYGNRWMWEDELGELSDELDAYFKSK